MDLISLEEEMKTVSFTRMADGTKEDYELLSQLEEAFICYSVIILPRAVFFMKIAMIQFSCSNNYDFSN